MKNISVYKISPLLAVIFVLNCLNIFSVFAIKDNKYEIKATYYEFNKDSNYKISDNKKVYDMDHQNVGEISITGSVAKEYELNGITAYEISDSTVPSIHFSYNDTLLNSSKKEWHLYEDSDEKVNGVSFDDDIDYGALILQTSTDREHWYTNYKKRNIKKDVDFSETKYINDIQLINGCYYRLILAYEVQKEIEPYNISILGWESPLEIPENSYKKNAEVYEFYLGYKESTEVNKKDIETYNLGETKAFKVDNGYSDEISMNNENPHLGWEIGHFTIGGFTNKVNNTNENVFLKNVDDKVTLWFSMNSGINIKKLNNNSDLVIARDINGYDRNMNVPEQDFGKGTLILRYTDYKGVKHDPIIYTNFFEALTSPGANTKIQLFDEGDYEVALDYEMKNTKGLDKLYNYKIAFSFKIRNSNTMVYPRDIETSSYLSTDSVTANGFNLDWAKSRYLDINVIYSRWTKGTNGYVEDVIYNRAAKESDVFDKHGIYKITVTNPTTDPNGNNPTVKKIYVGSDSVLIASMNAKNSSYSINDISNLVDKEGYTINKKGELIPPVITEAVTTVQTTESLTMINTSITASEIATSETTSIVLTEINSETSLISDNSNKSDDVNYSPFFIIGILIIGGTIVLSRKKNKQDSEDKE